VDVAVAAAAGVAGPAVVDPVAVAEPADKAVDRAAARGAKAASVAGEAARARVAIVTADVGTVAASWSRTSSRSIASRKW
jgi:hypothetical protein